MYRRMKSAFSTPVSFVATRFYTALTSDGKKQHSVYTAAEIPIASASISDPFVSIRLADGTVKTFVGDSVARQISEVEHDIPACQAVEVFADTTGIYRTFEAARAEQSATQRSNAIRAGQQSRMQLTQQQIQRLQDEKPAITDETTITEQALDEARGTQWLAALTASGELQIRSLPDMAVVLQSTGLSNSEPSFTDDAHGEAQPQAEEEEADQVKQLTFALLGREHPRPHVLVSASQAEFRSNNDARPCTTLAG